MRILLLVDIQNDFLPGGPLAVPGGDEIIPRVNRIQPWFDHVLATKDWHPPNHVSFARNHSGRQVGDVITHAGCEQVLWPVHCVQQSAGADFPSELDSRHIEKVFLKGIEPGIDSYSGFFDNQRASATGLDEHLRGTGAKHVFLAGLATDYCVKFTVLDACRLGYRVSVLEDACRGVNIHEDDVRKAWEAMTSAGAVVVQTEDLA